MMKHVFVLGLFYLFSIGLKSQISITSAQMPLSNDNFRYSNASINSVGNYTLTGANYNWHFDTLKPISQGIREFKSALLTPYFFYFFPPKYGEKILDSLPINIPGFSIQNIYSFYKKNGTSSFNSEGLGLSLAGIPIGVTFSDEDELYKFPLNYLDRDSTTFSLTTPSNSLIPFTYKKQGYRITLADGWGTITTPYGTANCLRVVTTQYSIDTITIKALPSPFNKIGLPNYERKYQWLTLGERIPYFEIAGNIFGTFFTPTQYRYRDNERTIVGLQEKESNPFLINIFPNPSSNEITLVVPKNNDLLKATISNLEGKIMLSKLFNKNDENITLHHIDISELAKGVYILTVTLSNQQQSLKFNVQ